MNPFSQRPRGVRVESARDIDIAAPDWNFPGYLVRGMVTVLDGHDPHVTQCIAVELAAIQSRSETGEGRWPDGTKAERGRTVFITTLRNAEYVLMPWVLAAKPNWRNFNIIRRVDEGSMARMVDMTTDAWDIDAKLQEMGEVRLIVFGPIDPNALKRGGKRDVIKRVFEELADLAEKHHAAVLVIAHALKEESTHKAVQAVANSTWFPSLPVLLLVAAPLDSREEDGKQSGVLVPVWSKFGPPQGGLNFELESVQVKADSGREAQAQRVTWGEPIPGSSKTILDAAARDRATDESADGLSQMERAKAFLLDVLAGGPMRKEFILSRAQDAEISDSTLERARKALGIAHAKERGTPHGKFVWSLPEIKERASSRRHLGTHRDYGGDVEGDGQVDRVARLQRDSAVQADIDGSVGGVGRVGRAERQIRSSDAPFMEAESQLPDLDIDMGGTDSSAQA